MAGGVVWVQPGWCAGLVGLGLGWGLELGGWVQIDLNLKGGSMVAHGSLLYCMVWFELGRTWSNFGSNLVELGRTWSNLVELWFYLNPDPWVPWGAMRP